MSRYPSTKEIRAVNKKFRAADDSSLWPIRGAFSVAERAINRVRRLQRLSGGCYYECVESYKGALEQAASEIVNNNNNW